MAAEDQSRPFGVDGVIVVNLDRRPDRWESFQAAWKTVLPWDQVVRLSASDGQQLAGYGQAPWFRGRKRDRTWAGRAGCTLSHARAMREAKRLGWSRVLVLEDDAGPNGPAGALVEALSSSPWDMLYLGGREPIGVRGPASDGRIRIHGAFETHAYVVTEPLRDWLIEHLPDESTVWAWIARERAVDRWMRREIGRRFEVMLCEPPLAVQTDAMSDITLRPGDISTAPVMAGASNALPATFELVRMFEIVGDRIRATLKRAAGF